MRFKRIKHKQRGDISIAIENQNSWEILSQDNPNILDHLDQLNILKGVPYQASEYEEVIPFQPASFRDFMLYEKHAIDAARGFVKKYMPGTLPIVKAYESIFRKPFPKLKPNKLFYKHPIFYIGNHLNFFTDGDDIAIPTYTKELDYELEIAAVLKSPLKNAKLKDVDHAIGGFVILNDFSARDVQYAEMNSGFGPMKTKNFANAISKTVADARSILDQIDDLQVRVFINEELIVENTSKDKYYSIQEAIAYASWEEQLHPGELFASGTIPGCAGIENGRMLIKGDVVKLEVDGIGSLENRVV